MKKLLIMALLVAGCDSGSKPPSTEPLPVSTPPPTPAAPPKAEPEHILVQHVLISFAGASPRIPQKRSKQEAEALAKDVFERARKGEPFDRLMGQSDDTGPGQYGISNHGISPGQGEFQRKGMVPAFGNVGFQLGLGDVGLAGYHPTDSPYGWHIIKRVK
jgi:hypothetical protein